jgi:hypothetical protein
LYFEFILDEAVDMCSENCGHLQDLLLDVAGIATGFFFTHFPSTFRAWLGMIREAS